MSIILLDSLHSSSYSSYLHFRFLALKVTVIPSIQNLASSSLIRAFHDYFTTVHAGIDNIMYVNVHYDMHVKRVVNIKQKTKSQLPK